MNWPPMHRRQDPVKDGVEGTVTDLHKYRNERHVVIKTDNGEERDLKVSDYCKNWIHLFP